MALLPKMSTASSQESVNVTKKNFADVIKLRILRREILLWIIWVVQCDHRGPTKREAVGSESVKAL